MNTPNEITAQQKLTDLGWTLSDSIDWNYDSMFPKLKGMGVKGEIKRKCGLIKQVEPVLMDTLLDGEEVQYIAKGVQVRFAEQYFLGAWSALINQTVFVLTNVRLLMFNTNTRGKPHNSIWMVYYSEIKKFKQRWISGFTMKLNDKSKFVFLGFKGSDRKSMPRIFERIRQEYQELDFQPEVTQSRETLCTVCKQVVPKKEFQCSNCGQEYWKPDSLAVRSLFFPSWGDWIMGHRMLAIIELLGYLITLVVLSLLAIADIVPLPFALIILAVEHVVDASITRMIAKKGLTPKKPLVGKPIG